MAPAREIEAKKVEKLYSTKPKRIVLGSREYRIPSNYFGPKERDEPDTFVAKENGFGFFMFLPEFEGYTKENWRDPFDRRLIQVIWVKIVDKDAMLTRTDGVRVRIAPAMYGDPNARFKRRRLRLEKVPSFKLYGLEGFRWKTGAPGITWVGNRSNGEFFFFESTLQPGEQPLPGRYASCQAAYYSETEDLYIAYRYPQEHLHQWREIDDAVWGKLSVWRVK